MSQFAFLEREWTDVYDAAVRAERAALLDPRTACFYARRSLELAVNWAYKHDADLRLPYTDNLSALIHEPSFKAAAGEAVFSKAKVIVTLGNRAVHGFRPVPAEDAIASLRELFHVAYWFARSYAREQRPDPRLAFDPKALPAPQPEPSALPKKSAEQLQALELKLREKDEKLSILLADKSNLDEELKKLRAEVAAAKAAARAEARPDDHDYSEAETRDYFIDLLLKEAGWALDQERDREYEVEGMPNNQGKGYVDYVLWGDDGKPLGLVEAKRTRRDAREGKRQAELYADCLERRFGRRPFIFYSNGYEHWIWDDLSYPPRSIQGFYTKAELELLVFRRSTRKSLAGVEIDASIVERYYQTRAIRRVAESFEHDHERKALLVMATGAGKTRTVIALCDLLMRANWVKRVLFLADRVALVKQAVNAFKQHLSSSSPINLVTEKDSEGRVYVSTYQTMMGLIDERSDGQRRFGPGYFDLVVIDEAHRSVFQKYGAILDYFDSFLVGLTATPKDEVDRNTYGLFDLENGVPTDAYSLDEAVLDGFLVPAKAVSLPLKFQREGIRYDDLTEDEQEQWDELEWDDSGDAPDRVESEAVNTWLFNKDTVDKVLEHLMTRGLRVAGGDRLGKTIIFAKNRKHAEFIVECFDANYPHLKGKFASSITFKTDYAQSLIEDFYGANKDPIIAVSVDMMDTGIDVPEAVNLVFFKLVRSKTKFWQMLGRGTRLCPELFGPGQDKRFFYVFDYCQNLEYFSQELPGTEGSLAASLGARLFSGRLELVAALDRRGASAPAANVAEPRSSYGEPADERQLRDDLAGRLQSEVAAMNTDNFLVRPRRRLVERYAKADAWAKLSAEDIAELSSELAGLPTELESENEEAKRFDYLALRLQLALVEADPGFEGLRDRVKEIAGLLEEKSSIPMIRERLSFIQEVQGDEWWTDVTLPMLEAMRRRLRDIVRLIEKRQRKIVYTDFEDELGEGTEVELPDFTAGTDYERFVAKTRAFLREHLDNAAIRKLRMNEPLESFDIEELERILVQSGAGGPEDLARAAEESRGLGLFVRSLVGLDQGAAKQALSGFIAGKNFSSQQIEFINLIIDHLTERGVVESVALYESPFTDLAPHGPEELFGAAMSEELFQTLAAIRANAAAA